MRHLAPWLDERNRRAGTPGVGGSVICDHRVALGWDRFGSRAARGLMGRPVDRWAMLGYPVVRAFRTATSTAFSDRTSGRTMRCGAPDP